MMKCGNCTQELPKKLPDVCMLEALMGMVVNERQTMTDEAARHDMSHPNFAVDEFWDDLGAVLDKLENGSYIGGAS